MLREDRQVMPRERNAKYSQSI